MICGGPCTQPTSVFAKAYSQGLHKSKYWQPVLEDSLNLIAKLPAVAAHIYRTTYHAALGAAPADPALDWAANLSHMMGARPPILLDGAPACVRAAQSMPPAGPE